jgi:hypothetical protein
MKLFGEYRQRKMGGGIYLEWWLVERRVWVRVFGIPVGWRWVRYSFKQGEQP